MKKLNIMVSGAAGFIGSHVCEAYLKQGHRVFGFDNFDPFYDRSIKECNLAVLKSHPNFSFAELDLVDKDNQYKWFEFAKPDVVIHLAAKAGVRPSIEAPSAYIRTNIVGTHNVLDICVALGIKKILFASSSSVYGNNTKVPFSEEDFVDNPISPYAATKKSCELLCSTYAHLHGLQIACLRFFTVYGPRQRPDLAISKFIRLIGQGKSIPFYGDGSTRRDYTYIGDIVSGVECSVNWVLHQTDAISRVFNLGESQTISLKDLVQTIETALGKKAIIDPMPLQPGDVNCTFADISRSKRELGYNPTTTIVEGLSKYVDWLRQNSSLHIPR